MHTHVRNPDCPHDFLDMIQLYLSGSMEDVKFSMRTETDMYMGKPTTTTHPPPPLLPPPPELNISSFQIPQQSLLWSVPTQTPDIGTNYTSISL